MARTVARLSALEVTRAKKPGMYPDGGGLYLRVTGAGARSWIFRYMRNGRERFMGLGSASSVSLADAREKATDCRKLLSQGIDPLDAREHERQRAALDAAKAMTFRTCAEAYIASHGTAFRTSSGACPYPLTAIPILKQPLLRTISGTIVRLRASR